MAYTKQTFTSGQTLKASDLNTMSQGIVDKQDKLVSGTNIKTINGQTLLGSGNIQIEADATTSVATSVKPKPVIFDTDFYDDVDDAVAIRVLLWAEQHGMCDIVGMVVTINNDKIAEALSKFLDFEGRGNLPFAIEKNTAVSTSTPSYFNTIANNWNSGLYSSNDDCEDEDNGSYYVKLLQSVPEGEKCNIIVVGYGVALAGLINKAVSDDSIMTLLKNKVDKIYMMGGKYPNGGYENNLGRNSAIRQASIDICSKTPSEIPIIFLGFEVGDTVLTGGTIKDTLGDSDLLYKALVAYGFGSGRPSWDPMVTLLAVYDDPIAAGYDLVQGTNTVSLSDGANTFTKSSTGSHYYVVKRYADTYYKHVINSILEKNAWVHREVGRVQYVPVADVLVLQGIAVTKQPTVTSYTVGDTFSVSGMQITATYFNETTGSTVQKVVSNYSYSPKTMTKEGSQTITISYTYQGVMKTATVTVDVAAKTITTHSITANVANGTYFGDTTITTDGTASVTVTPNDSYVLPTAIKVSGATYNYNSETGVISLSNPTANVVISVSCVNAIMKTHYVIEFNGDENWKFNTDLEPNTNGIYNCWLIDRTIVPAASTVKVAGTDRGHNKYGAMTCSDSRFDTTVFNPRENSTTFEAGYYFIDPSIYFRFDSTIATTADEFKTWLSNNPVTVYIEKA